MIRRSGFFSGDGGCSRELSRPGRRSDGRLAVIFRRAQLRIGPRSLDMLHLCGHDDHEDDDRARMRQRERHYLQALGLPDIAE